MRPKEPRRILMVSEHLHKRLRHEALQRRVSLRDLTDKIIAEWLIRDAMVDFRHVAADSDPIGEEAR